MINRLAFVLLAIVALTLSCKKYESVKKAAPEMKGDWTHYSENEGFHTVYIRESGRGSMYGINSHGNTQDPQERGWYIKDDVLYFTRFQNKVQSEKFTIDLYPTIAELEITDEYNTVEIGEWYMLLNNRIYTKKE